MAPKRTTSARIIAKTLSALGFVIVGALIFYLTVQAPTESVALSSRFGDLVQLLAARLGTGGLGGAVAQIVQTVPVRRLGHAGEFFAFGISASMLVIAWSSHKSTIRSMVLVAFGLCMTASLFDQVHKIFVPVRHFDWKDLPFDALGYALAIALTFACCALARALFKRLRPSNGADLLFPRPRATISR